MCDINDSLEEIMADRLKLDIYLLHIPGIFLSEFEKVCFKTYIQETHCNLPFQIHPSPKGTQRSCSPILLIPTHCTIPASNNNRYSLGTHQSSKTKKKSPTTADNLKLTHRPHLPEYQVGCQQTISFLSVAPVQIPLFHSLLCNRTPFPVSQLPSPVDTTDDPF